MQRHKRALISVFISIPIIFSSGCTEKDRSIYFPLAKKMQWQYLTTMVYTRRSVESKLILENIGSKIIEGKTVFTKLHHNGQKTYFFQTEDAILRNAEEPAISNEDADKESHFVIPTNLKEGKQWQLNSRPYVMERAIEYEVALQNSTPALKLSRPLKMNFKLLSLDEEVNVPAGRFNQCAKIQGKGICYMSAIGGNFSGQIEINVEHTDWYCPGIGLTKTIRSEVNSNNMIDPVSYHLELQKVIEK